MYQPVNKSIAKKLLFIIAVFSIKVFTTKYINILKYYMFLLKCCVKFCEKNQSDY